MSRLNRLRRGRVLAASLSIAAAVATASCSSGQHAQTAQVKAGVDGAHGAVGSVQLADVTLAYPPSSVYEPGSDARVEFTVINSGSDPVKLVSVTSPAAAGATSPDLTVAPLSTVGAYGDGPTITLTGLKDVMRSSQQADVTFEFSGSAGQQKLTLGVPVAAPLHHLGSTSASASSTN